MKNNSVRFHDVEAQTATAMRVAKEKAALTGANGTYADRDSLLFAFRPVHELMASILSDIDFKLQMKASEFAAMHNLVNKDAEEKRLEKEINDDREREVTLAAYAKPATGKFRRIGMMFLLVFLSVVESSFSQTALEKLFRTTYAGSILIGLGLATLFALVAHEGVPRYLEGGNRKRRMAVVVAAAAGVFLMFGILRMDGLPADIAGVVRLLSFCVISTISFVAACLIGLRLWEAKKTAPTDDEIRAAGELEAVRKRIADNGHRLEMLKKHSAELEVYTAHLLEYGTGLKQKVTGEARGIFFDFLKSAHRNREAGADPGVFTLNDYPFPLGEAIAKKPAAKTGIVPVVLLFVAAGLLFSCTDKPAGGEIAVTVLFDQSVETPQEYPSADDLIRFTGLDRTMWSDGVRISISTIADVDYAPVHTHVLEGAERWNSNIDDRADTLARFREDISASLEQTVPQGSRELRRSVVYRTVARHLTELHGLPYRRRYLLVWSDCMNNDAGTGFYGASGRRLLKQPAKLEQRLLEQVPLGDLSGVTLCIIHKPDEKTNADFLAASGFFERLFSGHGATVRISATLPNP